MFIIKIRTFILSVFALILSICNYSAMADDLDSLRSTVRSQICPGSTSKYDLIRGSCKQESARMAVSNSNEAYNAFMQCEKEETERNRLINRYNEFMNKCDQGKNNYEEQSKKNRQEIINHQKETASKIDDRLNRARVRSETVGAANRNETQNMINQADTSERNRIQKEDNLRREEQARLQRERDKERREKEIIDRVLQRQALERAESAYGYNNGRRRNSYNAARCKGCIDEQDCRRFCED